jgi:predicted alpha/beta superfamily hydrolase
MLARFLAALFLCVSISSPSSAEDLVTPVPQRITLRSKILNEDRAIWVRMPVAAQGKTDRYPVAYLLDGGMNVNELGTTADFLADNNMMPPLIVVGIINTDRARDLTPYNAGIKHTDGSVDQYPTSGGAGKFLDFIQKELVPEIDKKYPTQPFRIIAGHSLGGLLAVHALFNRPDVFGACIATSPSIWWDDDHTVKDVQAFLAKQKTFNKTFFFVLGNEDGDILEAFERMKKVVATNHPAGFIVKSEHYLDEVHSTTEMMGYYHGLRAVFAGWTVPLDPKLDIPVGGLRGLDRHYDALEARFGFKVSREKALNGLGYGLLRAKKLDDAIAAFRRNIELYPRSPNGYDSLAEALEAAGKKREAVDNVNKAIQIATETGDPLLPDFKKHLESLNKK